MEILKGKRMIKEEETAEWNQFPLAKNVKATFQEEIEDERPIIPMGAIMEG